MHRILVSIVILPLLTCGLTGCDSFREVHIAPRHAGGATLIASDAKDVDALVAAVKSVAARSKLTCSDNPVPGIRVACGPWFHSISVTHTDSAPIIELHLAHPGPSFGHDSDCDQIEHWAQDLQAQLGELDVTSELQPCH